MMTGYGRSRLAGAMLAAMAVTLPMTAVAQVAQTVKYVDDGASPFGKVEFDPAEAAKLEMPRLQFAATAEDEASFDKYYYFHRAGVSYGDAYVDIVECDGYARGLSGGYDYRSFQTPYVYQGTLAGAAGSVIASVMIAAIFGSAEKRRMRRVNMRQCMNFKGYQRYGLSKALWEEFHFEEGLSDMPERRRFDYLKRQALVASSAVPEGKELGL